MIAALIVLWWAYLAYTTEERNEDRVKESQNNKSLKF